MPQVFISYAAPDTEAATRLVQAFQQQGINAWAEVTHLKAGENWNDAVKQALLQADACILLLSAATFKLPSVAREYQYFLKHHKPVYGAIIGNVVKDEMPAAIMLRKHVDLRPDFAAGVQRLATYIMTPPEAVAQDISAQRASMFSTLKVSMMVNGDIQQLNAALVAFVERLEATGMQVGDIQLTDRIDD